jgi:DNA adenine methylase
MESDKSDTDDKRSLPPPFCRQGNKYPIRDIIIPLIPPHKRYVELFAGSGAIFYNKDKADQNILNDLDKKTIANFRLIQNAPLDPAKYAHQPKSLSAVKHFFDHHGDSIADRLIHERIRSCSGFSNQPVTKSKQIYVVKNVDRVLKLLGEYKDKLKGVKYENKDYEAVVKKYDSPDTFFFIDPPYENTEKSFGYAQSTDFDFERLREVLSKIKGDFLMTINDSKRIRDLFRQFNIKPIKVPNAWSRRDNSKQKAFRPELIITNYSI